MRIETAEKRRSQKRNVYRRRSLLIRDKIHTTGIDGEFEALGLLNNSNRVCKDYDIEWNGKSVDVKTSSLVKSHTNNNKDGSKNYSWRWKFTLKRQKGKVDYFLCIGKTADTSKTEFVLLIPDGEINKNHLSISIKSLHKYKKYEHIPPTK